MHFISMLGLMAGLALCVTGCKSGPPYGLTHALWTRVDVRNFCLPAPDPHLELHDDSARQDVLVVYDQLDEKKDTIQRRAYYLEHNRGEVAARKSPVFVDATAATTLPMIPVIAESATNTTLLPIYAVQSKSKYAFVIHRSGKPALPGDLPFYPENSNTLIKVVLTPFAVVGDSSVVGFLIVYTGCVTFYPENYRDYDWH